MRKSCITFFATLMLCATCLAQSAPPPPPAPPPPAAPMAPAAPPPSQPESPRIKPPTATTSTTMSVGSSLEEMLIAREKEVWENIKRKDVKSFADFLADDQIYVTGDGAHSKAETLQGVSGSTTAELTLDEWKVVPVDNNNALVTYRVTVKGTDNGKEMSVVTRETTLWTKRNGKWLAIFHQDTMAQAGK